MARAPARILSLAQRRIVCDKILSAGANDVIAHRHDVHTNTVRRAILSAQRVYGCQSLVQVALEFVAENIIIRERGLWQYNHQTEGPLP